MNLQQRRGITYGGTSSLIQRDRPQAILFAQFVVQRISIRDTEISAAVFPKLMEDGKTQLVGRGASPSPTLVLLLTTKNINSGDHRDCRRLGFSGMMEKAKIDGGSLSYDFPEPVALRKNGPMFSRGFIRYSTGLGIASSPGSAQSREMIAASNYHSAKQRSKS